MCFWRAMAAALNAAGIYDESGSDGLRVLWTERSLLDYYFSAVLPAFATVGDGKQLKEYLIEKKARSGRALIPTPSLALSHSHGRAHSLTRWHSR